MIRDCKVLLIRVPRNEEGRVVTGGDYKAMIAVKEKVILDSHKVIYREWVETIPMLTVATDYEELFRVQLAKHISGWLGYGSAGKFKFYILDKMLQGRDYDVPIEHLQMLIDKIKRGEKI